MASWTEASVSRPRPLRKRRTTRSGHHPAWRIHRPWKKFLLGKLQPFALPGKSMICRITRAVSGGIRSSASSTRIQASRHRSTADCFCGPKPRHGSLKTSQPKSAAIRVVSSALPESTTTICRAKATLRRQSGRFSASFFTMIATESGAFSAIDFSHSLLLRFDIDHMIRKT